MTSTPPREPPPLAAVAAALLTGGLAGAATFSQPYLTPVGNALITACAAVAGAMLVYGLYPSHIRRAAATVITVAVIVAGITWHALRLSDPVPQGVAGLIGGCTRFNLFAQNRYPPLGARVMETPLPAARKVGGRAGNEIVTVDGWARTRAPYPTNTAPWNSDIWFHLADQSGWVSFAGLRSEPSSPDMNGHDPYGGEPAGLDRGCEGTVRWP